jgi:hypothetical protein
MIYLLINHQILSVTEYLFKLDLDSDIMISVLNTVVPDPLIRKAILSAMTRGVDSLDGDNY